MAKRPPVKKSALSCDDICRIITACAQAPVSKLKFADLEIDFGRPAEPHVDLPPAPGTTNFIPTDAAISETAHNENMRDALEREEAQVRQEQIADLLITNPLLAEQMIQNDELGEDDGSESAEES